MEQHEKYERMTTWPVSRLVGRLAIPTTITMLVTALYNMADTFFVGLLDNTSATGAVGVVFSFMAVIQACGFFFGQGSGTYIARFLGQEQVEDAQRMVSTGFFTAVATGVAIMMLGLSFLEPLAYLLGSTETILPYAKAYLRIILLGAPYMIGALVLNNQLRFQGNAFYSMLGIGSGALLNVVLDPLFIFGLKMGVAGAALATIISQFVSFVVLLICCQKGDNLRVSFRLFRPRRSDYAAILRGGFPTLCRQGLSSISTVCLNFMAGVLGGDAAIAAMAVVAKIMHVAFCVLLGFGQGFQPVCGFNYGAGLYRRVKEAFWFCVRIGTALLLAASVAGWIFAARLVGLFSQDADVIRIGMQSLRWQCVVFPTVGFSTMCNMMMQTMGFVGRSSFLSMARQGIFFIPFVLFLPWVFSQIGLPPLLGVQMAQAIADALTLVASMLLVIGVLRGLSFDRTTDVKMDSV